MTNTKISKANRYENYLREKEDLLITGFAGGYCVYNLKKLKGYKVTNWRRIRLIPFNVTIPEEERDINLTEKLKAEYEGILAWAVEGCRLYLQEGLTPPEEVKQATEEYRQEMDILSEFINECCVIGENYQVLSTALYETYKNYINSNGGGTILSHSAISKRLVEKGFLKERKTSGISKGKIFYRGIGIPSKKEGFTGEKPNDNEDFLTNGVDKQSEGVKDGEAFFREVLQIDTTNSNDEIKNLSEKSFTFSPKPSLPLKTPFVKNKAFTSFNNAIPEGEKEGKSIEEKLPSVESENSDHQNCFLCGNLPPCSSYCTLTGKHVTKETVTCDDFKLRKGVSIEGGY